MPPVCCVIAAIFVAASAAAADRIPPEVVQGRDLRSYDDGGVYRTPIGQREVVRVSEARRFVWTHWTQKRRGYVTVVQQGKMLERTRTSSSSLLRVAGTFYGARGIIRRYRMPLFFPSRIYAILLMLLATERN